MYYDEEGDFLEINLGDFTEGYFKNLGRGLFERIDHENPPKASYFTLKCEVWSGAFFDGRIFRMPETNSDLNAQKSTDFWHVGNI